MPPRLPVVSVSGTSMVRSWAWCTNTVPSGIRWQTMARNTITPLRLTASTQSLSATPILAASAGLIHIVGPPRDSDSMNRLSWYSEWIDHFECGVRYRTHSPSPSLIEPISGLAEQPGHVQRRPEHRQLLAEFLHPVVVDVEVHPAGQRVPGLELLDVHGERRVPAAAGLAARPFRAGDHRHRPGLGVGVGDPFLLAALGEVDQRPAGAPLQFAGTPRRRAARWTCRTAPGWCRPS